MFKLNELKSEAKRVIVRFPLVIVSAVFGLAIWNVLIQMEGYFAQMVVLIYGLFLGIPIHYSAVIAKESSTSNRIKSWMFIGFGIVVHGLIITHLQLSSDLPEIALMTICIFYFITSHLLASFLPFLVGMRKDLFWNFNQWMFSRFALSSIFTGIIAIGLGLAIGAIQLLFEMFEDGRFIAEVLITVCGIFHILFFFAGTPTELNQGNWVVDPPKPFRILVQYILVPLVVLYLSILYIYLAKILFTFDLPKGNVSVWILVFCTLGILSILLAEPFRNVESNWVGKLTKIFYWLMLPLLVMLWIAIYTRVLAYGVTEARALVLYLAIWLTFISLYNGFYKRKSLLAFPISLFIITFLYQWGGPLSAHSISFKSQSIRTEEIMSRDSIDEEELLSQLIYMYNFQSEHTEWFESNQLPLQEHEGVAGYQLISNLIDSDRFRDKLIRSSAAEEEFVYGGVRYVNVNLNEISVQGFNEMHFLTFGSKAKISDFTVTYKDNGKEIIREFKKEFYSFCEALDRQAANQPAFTYDWSEDGKQFRLVIYEYNYPFAPSSSEGSSVNEGVLLVR
ncbi:MAG: hypothetical protein RLZZ91_407 [Bacteroidota bacterium]|jgi:hypothetical protein